MIIEVDNANSVKDEEGNALDINSEEYLEMENVK
jgi:hypothetical protein